MARSALLGVSSVGLFVGTLVFSFIGCYTDETMKKGECQPTNMALDECMVAKCNADGTPAPVPVPNAERKVCFRGENEGICVDGACALTCETEMTPCKCSSDAACPSDKQCVDWACTMGECKSTLTADGTLVDPLQMGDCKKSVCQGGMPQTVADAADLPDNTPKDCKQPACNGDVPTQDPDTTDIPDATGCTSFTCNAQGTAEPMNAPIGTACAAGACDSAGMCLACLPKEEWDVCKTPCPVPKCEGQPCLADAECKNACVDGVCCDKPCTEECKACNVMGAVGKCTNIPYLGNDLSYTDSFGNPNVPCAAPYFCNGSGKCLGGSLAPCTSDAACLGGDCAPANLCLGAKDEPCMANGQCASGTCTNNKCT
jgi:hypothetical protein